jgi:hypothetical protein
MPLVPPRSNFSAKVKTLIEKCQCLALGAFIGFFIADETFELTGKEAADRSVTPRS